MNLKKLITTLLLSITICNIIQAQSPDKKAAILEFTILDMNGSSRRDEPGTYRYVQTDLHGILSPAQKKMLYDTLLNQIKTKYQISTIKNLQKDSIKFFNSQLFGFGKIGKKDKELLGGQSFDYLIKIYAEFIVNTPTLLTPINAAKPKLSLSVAVFDSSQKRIWYPDINSKGGTALGNSGTADTYFNSNEEKANVFIDLYQKCVAKLF